MAGNEFNLPDDLGWECNDKISQHIDDWLDNVAKYILKDGRVDKAMWQVAKAELMDDIYSIVKEYQEGKS